MPRAYDRKLLRILLRDENVKVNVQKLDELYSKVDELDNTLANLVLENNLIPELKLISLVAGEANIPPIDLKRVKSSEKLFAVVDKNTAQKFKVFPISQVGTMLTVAVGDPFDRGNIENLEIMTHCKLRLVLSTDKAIQKAITDNYKDAQKTADMDLDKIIDDLEDEKASAVETEDEMVNEEIDKGIIGLANKVIIDAFNTGVSDIHVEPYMGQEDTVIRFRLDGDCFIYRKIPNKLKKALVARIKIMAGLDIAERRLPQDGKIKFKKYGGLDIELRVATVPTVGGNEDAVMRILAASKPMPLEEMGFSDRNITEFKKMVEFPYGLVLVVGPTGSGKTTTLHSAMGYINNPTLKIWTAEDPVEITQYGLRQVQIHHKIGFTFAAAMRSFLRADPDVIMVGEMRDFETASMGIEASLTGHLVLSTLHTNSAPETIVRLIDMGLDPFNFADALIGVLAQRLTRRLCKNCRQDYQPSQEEYEELVADYAGDFTRYGPKFSEELKLNKLAGCPKCNNLGYRGRLAIHELLAGTDAMKTVVQRKGKVEEIRKIAVEDGMTTLKQDGILKVFQGLTDILSVRSVCIK